MPELYCFLALSLLLAGVPVGARAETNQAPTEVNATSGPSSELGDTICPMIEAAARVHGLPIDFFTRVIWQESRFRPDEIGPVTRSGARAQGIAQFMPGTAAERGLVEPFNPVEALPKSGEFLAELRDQFGNLGLAAAAYNAGPQRVRDFIAGLRGLPLETRNYVLAITGHPVEEWVKPAQEQSGEGSKVEPQMEIVPATCRDLVTHLKRSPQPVFAGLQQRKVPGWCRHVHHPNVNVCGSVHQEGPGIRTIGQAMRASTFAIRTSSLTKARARGPAGSGSGRASPVKN